MVIIYPKQEWLNSDYGPQTVGTTFDVSKQMFSDNPTKRTTDQSRKNDSAFAKKLLAYMLI